jgi:putative flippase GtrA
MAMSLAPRRLAHAAWEKLPELLRRPFRSEGGRRLLRFAPAALLALGATQITYFFCASVLNATGRVSGAVGWFAGVVVSYGVSRWAWERRGRPNLLKETLPFVAISLIVGAVLTEASHFAYREASVLVLHGIERALFLQGAFLAANCITFLARFVIFHFVLFADRNSGAAEVTG